MLVCRICEKDHDSGAGLRTHMRSLHTACEMPYICPLCNFRSSVYSDVVDHFKKVRGCGFERSKCRWGEFELKCCERGSLDLSQNAFFTVEFDWGKGSDDEEHVGMELCRVSRIITRAMLSDFVCLLQSTLFPSRP